MSLAWHCDDRTQRGLMEQGAGVWRVRLYEAGNPKGEQVFAGGYWLSYDGEWADFVSACRTGSPLAAPAEAAMGELRAALAMYRSAETKRWEPVWD